jgi:hypothetical protein
MLFVFDALIFRSVSKPPATASRLTAIAAAAVTALASVAPLAANDVVDLRAPVRPGRFQQTKVVIETEGKLKLNADGQEVKHLPLKVRGELHYFERVLTAKQWSEVRAVRAYQQAQATIRLHETELTTKLRPERRLAVLESGYGGNILFSPQGPLTREELDLVEAPAGSLALESLLPLRPTKIGSQWKLSDVTTARLLGLEAINEQDITCTLDSAKDNLAIISLAGKIAGAAGGVSSDIELKGKLNFDLKQQTVTWLTLAYKENRAIGHAQPGFEVTTTLKMVSAPISAVAELSDKALAGLRLNAAAGQTLIELASDLGGFELRHDRRWRVMVERGDMTVLRFVDRGDLVAQCNIAPRPALAKGEQPSMEIFQAEVQRALGENLEAIFPAAEETSNSSLHVLRVIARGKAGDLSIQWAYYDLSDQEGRRASVVITLESSLVERYGTIDRELIENLRFRDSKSPTSAKDRTSTVSDAADKGPQR